MWNRLIAVVEEQAQTMIRTAFSTTVREAGDLSAGIFDLQGRMLAQAVTGTPGHVNSDDGDASATSCESSPPPAMQPGDHYITNDPWLGTGHLHDLTVVTPAFRRGKIVGLFANTAHVIDIGGLGMGPEGRSVFEEGLYIPIVKCFDRGAPNETFFDFIRAGSRTPVELEGDIYSLCACNDAGAKRLVEMMDEFDDGQPRPAGRASSSTARCSATLEEIAKLPRGTFAREINSDGYEDAGDAECGDDRSQRTASRWTTPAPPACRRAASTCRPPIAAPIPASASSASWRRRSPTTGPARALPHGDPGRLHPERAAALSGQRAPRRSASCCPT